MSETTTTEETTAEESATDEATVEQKSETADETTDAEKALGDAGKKALDTMKADRNKAREALRVAQEELSALKAVAEGREAEHKAATEAQRVKDEALAAANDRIKRAEIRALAANKLHDPKDALLHLNLSDFEVDSDGEVDSSQIAAAIDDLISEKPYLAAQGGKRFQGSADGGARNEAAGKSQLSRDDLSRMSPDDIDKAEKEGRLDQLLGRT